MHRGPSEVSAAERAHWLTLLARALDEAQHVVRSLLSMQPQSDELTELHSSIELARVRVETLRSSDFEDAGALVDPEWTKFLSGHKDQRSKDA